MVPYFYILKFDRSDITLGSTHITPDHIFVTFGGTLFFSLQLIVQPSF